MCGAAAVRAISSRAGASVLLVPLALALLAVWYTWPFAVAGRDHFPYNAGDTALIAAGLRLHWHELLTDPASLGDDRIFYPLRGTAFFKDLELSAVLPFGLLYQLTGDAIAASSYTVLLFVVANAVALAALAHRWTGDRLAGFAAGVAGGLGPVVVGYLLHYQLMLAVWTPLTLLALDSFAARPRFRTALAALLCLWLQFVTAVYLSFYAAFAAAIYAAVVGASLARRPGAALAVRGWLAWPTIGRAVALAAIGAALFYLPVQGYQRQARAWDSQRTLDDVIAFSASPLSFLNPPDVSLLYGHSVLRSFAADAVADSEKRLFPGAVTLALAGVGLWQLRSNRLAGRCRARTVAALGIAAVGAVLALGPLPVVNGHVASLPLPYLALYRLLPGFQAMRSPSRFGLMMVLGLALLAGLGVAALRRRPRGNLFAGGLVVLLLVELSNAPLPMSRPIDDFPPRDLALLSAGAGPVAWLPVDGPGVDGLRDYVEAARMLEGPLDRPTVNGYSGFIPPPYLDFQRMAAIEEPPVVVAALERLGARTLVLDPARFDPPRLREWTAATSSLRQVGPTERLRLFDLPSAPGPSAAPRLGIVADRLPAGRTVGVWLDLANGSDAVWVNPRPDGKETATVAWRGPDGASLGAGTARVALPLYVAPGGTRSVEATVAVPASPGPRQLAVSLAGLSASRELMVTADAPPTSKGPNPDLRGALELTRRSPEGAVGPGAPLHLHGRVENRGAADWLSREQGRPVGTVRVGALWFRAGDEATPLAEQRIQLERDVPAGSSAVFDGVLRVPTQPGDYRLKLAVVAEGVAWLDQAPRGQGATVAVAVAP
ncbi:MAG TPA: hypothetical protein VFC93_16430 [Chloroflexota bacterium]|nr:hypothetical protein [Chloroflexota bacterium]